MVSDWIDKLLKEPTYLNQEILAQRVFKLISILGRFLGVGKIPI
jgi:hypothetical protein